MLGFLIFIPTLVYIPHYAYLLCIPYLIWHYYSNKENKLLKDHLLSNKIDLIIIGAIIFYGLLNNLLHYSNTPEGLMSKIPFYTLIILVFFIAKNLKKQDLRILIYLTIFEVGVAFCEMLFGVNTFFSSLELYRKIEDFSQLYYIRPLGLSANSSVIALKIFVSILLVKRSNFNAKQLFFVQSILIFGALITFNRTVLICIILYYSIQFITHLVKQKYNLKKGLIFIVFVLIIGLAITSFLTLKSESLWLQFTRGTGQIEFTGRDLIWENYKMFITENPLFGNGSYKFRIEGKHAHNSFLQVIATHGFLFILGYIILIYKNLKTSNIITISVILIYSTMQYGVFWGISLLDILLFFFLFTPLFSCNKEELKPKVKTT